MGLTMLLGLSSRHVALLASVCGLLSAGRPSLSGVRKMEGEQSSHPQGLAFHGDGLWNGGLFLPRDPEVSLKERWLMHSGHVATHGSCGAGSTDARSPCDTGQGQLSNRNCHLRSKKQTYGTRNRVGSSGCQNQQMCPVRPNPA